MTDVVVPYRRAGGHRTKNQRKAEAIEAMRLKRLGYLDSQIAEKLGCSLRTAAKRVEQAFEMFGAQSVGAYRKIAEMQYDVLIQALMPRVAEGDLDAIKEVHALVRDKAKLMGTEAPAQVEIELTSETPQERAMRDLLNQAREAEAQREADIVEGEVVEDEA